MIAFDVPGVGGLNSHPNGRIVSLAGQAHRADADYLDLARVNVVGVSWGGALARQFAYDYPERCRS